MLSHRFLESCASSSPMYTRGRFGVSGGGAHNSEREATRSNEGHDDREDDEEVVNGEDGRLPRVGVNLALDGAEWLCSATRRSV